MEQFFNVVLYVPKPAFVGTKKTLRELAEIMLKFGAKDVSSFGENEARNTLYPDYENSEFKLNSLQYSGFVIEIVRTFNSTKINTQDDLIELFINDVHHDSSVVKDTGGKVIRIHEKSSSFIHIMKILDDAYANSDVFRLANLNDIKVIDSNICIMPLMLAHLEWFIEYFHSEPANDFITDKRDVCRSILRKIIIFDEKQLQEFMNELTLYIINGNCVRVLENYHDFIYNFKLNTGNGLANYFNDCNSFNHHELISLAQFWLSVFKNTINGIRMFFNSTSALDKIYIVGHSFYLLTKKLQKVSLERVNDCVEQHKTEIGRVIFDCSGNNMTIYSEIGYKDGIEEMINEMMAQGYKYTTIVQNTNPKDQIREALKCVLNDNSSFFEIEEQE